MGNVVNNWKVILGFRERPGNIFPTVAAMLNQNGARRKSKTVRFFPRLPDVLAQKYKNHEAHSTVIAVGAEYLPKNERVNSCWECKVRLVYDRIKLVFGKNTESNAGL